MTKRKKYASDDRHNDVDQLDGGVVAGAADEEAAVVRGPVELLKLHAEGETVADAGGVFENPRERHYVEKSMEVQMEHPQTCLGRSCPHSL